MLYYEYKCPKCRKYFQLIEVETGKDKTVICSICDAKIPATGWSRIIVPAESGEKSGDAPYVGITDWSLKPEMNYDKESVRSIHTKQLRMAEEAGMFSPGGGDTKEKRLMRQMGMSEKKMKKYWDRELVGRHHPDLKFDRRER